MAIGEQASFWPTEGLLFKEGSKRYCTVISPIHWQLRSLISAERQDVIYFPTGINNTHITRLNTTTREYETIKVLSFHPRCLVARGGWVCCGGENGEFTIIRDTGQSNDTSAADAINNEIRSNLNSFEASNMAEASMTQLHRDMLNIVERINGSNKPWSASNHKIGSERVNCITIWQPAKLPFDAPRTNQYAFPVGVLANNDKTVTIVNLDDGEPVDELEYPDCVNRGVISPDGTLLVAICDDPFLYVHVQCSLATGKRGEYWDWLPLPRIRLRGQWNRDTSDCRGSFAACFSPSGRYLAVGTQYGTISIFDVPALANPNADPLVTYFNSARSPGDDGAVRDMAFSPGPYDLLAWTEHRGHIGIADARSGFIKRQIIKIDDHDGYDHVTIADRSTIDPRLLDPRSERNNASSSSSLPSLLSQSTSGRPLPNPESSETSRVNLPFTAEETAILEAVQSDRRRREAREQREREQQQAARGSAWRSSVWADRRDTLTRILERERARENRDHHRSATTQTPPEQDRERRAPTPRRRSSIMQALTQTVASQGAGGNNESSSTSRGSSSPWLAGRLTSGWADLEALYNMGGGDGGGTGTGTGTGAHDAPRTESSRVRRAIPVISDVWSDDISGFRRTYGRANSREHQQHSDDTAGLTWSEDGRTLYVGAEDGIYEFHVNQQDRKIFSDLTLR
ncbi:Uu.00g010010.m01.CDS01 [Anthostomella pinea]|uniref:Uu.00g010010.m01.CDS01 n=1 Tax=Anthostomella pinea TaxID=933095 RepID=A0AAI8VXI3_9PEZI|nr:Uu.00g010010.m01.CDS01 [Anthostomella pinea]